MTRLRATSSHSIPERPRSKWRLASGCGPGGETTAAEQASGAVMCIGMTMLDQTAFDSESGRIVSATFGDYLIAASADVPDLDVVFVGTPDTARPIGIKGIGEVGVVGVSAAIANALYHATGRRIRPLPVTVEQLVLARRIRRPSLPWRACLSRPGLG